MSRKERERQFEREAHQKAQSAIREAESKKLRIAEPEGNINFINNFGREDEREIRHNSRHSRVEVDDGYESEEPHDDEVGEQNLQNGQGNLHSHHPAVVDENYLVIGNYVEEHIRQRIENSEYVDFSRLLPRDRLAAEEDNRMEIVNKNGRTFFVPAVDADPGGISNFSRWDQAFRVFSNIYTRRFPGRASELIQYNHIIHTASLSYTWENVYLYDRDFRLHLSHFPNQSWAVILQQA